MGKLRKESPVAAKAAAPSPKQPAKEGGRGWLFSLDLHKPRQGRILRQVTAFGLGVVVVLGAWRLSEQVLRSGDPFVDLGVPALIVAVLGWLIFRLTYGHRGFSDFLIATEAEMHKVSWPGKDELLRATAVVLGTMVAMGGVLFLFDQIWVALLQWIGVLPSGGTDGSP